MNDQFRRKIVDSISTFIFLLAADCFDYAWVYEHPGPPRAFITCTVLLWAPSVLVDGNYSLLTLSLNILVQRSPGQ